MSGAAGRAMDWRRLLGAGALVLIAGACETVPATVVPAPVSDATVATVPAGEPTAAPLSLEAAVEAAFAAPDLAGAQWSMLAVDADGTPIISIRPGDRFLPASNVKILTTAAAMANLDAIEAAAPGTEVILEPTADGGPPDLILVGGADPALSAGTRCEVACLEVLADRIAASGLASVRHVIGDDRFLPHEPFPPGWSWEDLQWRYGAPVSALSVNRNTVRLSLSPGAALGDPVVARWDPGDGLLTVDNRMVTSGDPDAEFAIHRPVGSDRLELSGAFPQSLRRTRRTLAIDHAPLRAAERFAAMLEARGVAVQGEARAAGVDMPEPTAAPLTRLDPSPLFEEIVLVSKDSDNLGAELLLGHLGRLDGGSGSREDGLAVVEAMLTEAGVSPVAYDLADGSGMSIYNRISPGAMVQLLVWIYRQPWGETWFKAQPLAGVDGTLANRFAGTALESRLHAKTGTLFGANTLSGWLETDTGEPVLFSIMVNDRDSEVSSATEAMDRALVLLDQAVDARNRPVG